MTMKVVFQISLLLCLICGFGTTYAQTFYTGVKVRALDAVTPAPFVCTKVGGECGPDCKTRYTCSGSGKSPLNEFLCAGTTPFCAAGKCAAKMDPNQDCEVVADENFICSDEGIFPDPDTCNNYYDCDTDGVATLYTCGNGTYDAKAQACMSPDSRMSRIVAPPSCVPMVCPRTLPGYALYKPNNAYYMYCDESDIRIMAKCQDEENTIFDLAAEACVFVCKAEGDFVDRENCNKFYRCTKSGSRFKVSHNMCATNNYFSGTKCIKEENGPCVSEI